MRRLRTAIGPPIEQPDEPGREEEVRQRCDPERERQPHAEHDPAEQPSHDAPDARRLPGEVKRAPRERNANSSAGGAVRRDAAVDDGRILSAVGAHGSPTRWALRSRRVKRAGASGGGRGSALRAWARR